MSISYRWREEKKKNHTPFELLHVYEQSKCRAISISLSIFIQIYNNKTIYVRYDWHEYVLTDILNLQCATRFVVFYTLKMWMLIKFTSMYNCFSAFNFYFQNFVAVAGIFSCVFFLVKFFRWNQFWSIWFWLSIAFVILFLHSLFGEVDMI